MPLRIAEIKISFLARFFIRNSTREMDAMKDFCIWPARIEFWLLTQIPEGHRARLVTLRPAQGHEFKNWQCSQMVSRNA